MSHPPARPLKAHAASALTGRLAVPGDKSISHRALMFGALAVGTTEITGLLEGEDVLRTAAAMRALGATVDQLGPGHWRVAGRGVGGLVEPADVLDMGNSGTAARLICGLLAAHPIFAVLTGDASLRRRPMKRVTDPLAATGAQFWSREGGRLPLAIRGATDPLPLDYTLPVASAQVKSACLLAGLCAPGTTRVIEPEPTRDHTENMLRHFGATVRVTDTAAGRVIELEGQPELMAAPIIVPGDPSSAAFAIIAALLVPGSRVTVENVGLNPLRTGLFTTLREMGATLAIKNARTEGGEPVGDIVAETTALKAVDTPPDRVPSMVDEFPVLAVAAAAARGTTRMRGLKELRVKESDRLAATAALLEVNGIRTQIEGDDLLVHGVGGPPPGGGTVETHMDHRIAMSALVLGLASRAPVGVDDAAFIDTSFPGFAALMNGLAGGLRLPMREAPPPRPSPVNGGGSRSLPCAAGEGRGGGFSVPAGTIIAIDGPAAAGKGTLARRIAAALGLPYLDTGLLYRAVGRRVLDRSDQLLHDAQVAEAEARALTPTDLARPDLRGPTADMAASAVAAIPAVRAALLDFQRDFGRRHGAVLDGRDIGTVVFPDAHTKLFVTASVTERARRRFLELQARGVAADPAQVEAEIRDRDAQDANRPVAPLKPAEDAALLDTTDLDPDAAFAAAMAMLRDRLTTSG